MRHSPPIGSPLRRSAVELARQRRRGDGTPKVDDDDRRGSKPSLHPLHGGLSSTITQASNDGTEIPTNYDWPPEVDMKELQKWQSQLKNMSPLIGLKLPSMLPPPVPSKRGKILLCLDLDETLVHSVFKPTKPYNLHIQLEGADGDGDIFVAYRPHLFTFLDAIAPMFEVSLFTASQSCYAAQVMDTIDPHNKLGPNRLYREHCTEVNGSRVKDLSLLGRPLERVCIIDNSPIAYLFHPRNAIPILSWFEDERDTELLRLIPMLIQLAQATSVYDVLDLYHCRKNA